ncbi:MAG: FAD-dependent oxidoreductase [Gemmatimonadota bacterium]
MNHPFIVLVDDDRQVIRAILRDVRSRYRDDYRVVGTESAKEALELLQELKLKGESVALVISDQRMPEMEGVALLQKVRSLHPEAGRVLLTAYSDIEAAIRAINDVKLDYYLQKPWHPPEEKLYPIVDELLADWSSEYHPEEEGIRVVGYQWSPKSHHIKEFFTGNLVPYTWTDVELEEEKAEGLLQGAGVSREDLPLVVFPDGTTATDPTLVDLASRIGLQMKATGEVYDVAIIGAGPSGLAAAVYGASEGLRTLLVEQQAPGGQAGTSTRIENYLGFPKGLSGAELTRRALAQATRFGTEILTTQGARGVAIKDRYKAICLSDGTEIHSRALVITTGVAYRTLAVEGIDRFTGAGVYYGAAAVEARACKGEVVFVVGGGNSAGQAAMALSAFAHEVNILTRGESLARTASSYLIDQIAEAENIRVRPFTEVAGAAGDRTLEKLTLRNTTTGAEEVVDARALFIYIGARPTTDWLGDSVLLDDKGFVLTGRELMNAKPFRSRWKLDRDPSLQETSAPGVFAAGDVRSGSMARIASAVGEGAMAIKQVHDYLART